MKASSFHYKTLKEAPKDAELVSHKLMIRANMIKPLASGIYSWLPLGLKILNKVEEIIDKRYHPNNWNIYTFYCGDGDNWAIDNKEALAAFRRLKEINQVMCYTEVGEQRTSDYSLYSGQVEKKLWDWVRLAEGKTFKRVRITKSRDVWPAFKKLFGGKE